MSVFYMRLQTPLLLYHVHCVFNLVFIKTSYISRWYFLLRWDPTLSLKKKLQQLLLLLLLYFRRLKKWRFAGRCCRTPLRFSPLILHHLTRRCHIILYWHVLGSARVVSWIIFFHYPIFSAMSTHIGSRSAGTIVTAHATIFILTYNWVHALIPIIVQSFGIDMFSIKI